MSAKKRPGNHRWVKGQSGSVEHQFKPGVSGNPGGRPKKRPISDRYALWSEKALPPKLCKKYELPVGSTYGDALALRTFEKAIEGVTASAREIREAIEGTATHRVAITDSEGNDIDFANSSLNEVDEHLATLLEGIIARAGDSRRKGPNRRSS